MHYRQERGADAGRDLDCTLTQGLRPGLLAAAPPGLCLDGSLFPARPESRFYRHPLTFGAKEVMGKGEIRGLAIEV